MKFSTRFISSKKQAGLTLVELISSLAIMALVIGGALSLYGSASTSQGTTQTTAELSALRSAVKGLYYGQGGYGTTTLGGLNQVLVNGNKIPTTIAITAGTPPILTNSFGGLITVDGATSNFTLQVTAVPTATCLGLLSSANGWNSIKVGAAAAQTALPFPIATASTQCAALATQTIIFQSS